MMDGAGRPSLYKPEFAEQAYGLCLAGATNQELADGFDVGRSTIDNWLRKYPEFAQAVRSGRSLADGKVASGLYARAIGYNYEATRVLLHRGEPVTVRHIVHRPPDVRACIFWLRNRRPQQWARAPGRRATKDRTCKRGKRRSNGQPVPLWSPFQGRRAMSAPQTASFRTRRS